MNFSIGLSTKNFVNAAKIYGQNEFKFVIGSKSLYCHKFVASFLSKNIEQMLISDPTIDSFIFDLRQPKLISEDNQSSEQNAETIFCILQKLILGQNISVTSEDLQQVCKIDISQSSELKNFTSTHIYSILQVIEILDNDEIRQQLYERIFEFIMKDNNKNGEKKQAKTKEDLENKLKKLNNIEKVISLFQLFKKNSEVNFDNRNEIIKYVKEYLNQDYNEFINEISQNFSLLDDSIMVKLNDLLFEDILSSSYFQISNEDSLLKTILKRRSYIQQIHDQSSSELNNFLKYIQFEFLSETGIQTFLNEIQFEDINQPIWNKIVKRLILPVKIDSLNNTKQYTKQLDKFQFNYSKENPLNGIFEHLTDASKGNIQLNNTIEIKCSRLCCGKLHTIVDSNNSSERTHIERESGIAWLQFDFKERKIQLNSYLIKSRDDYNRHLKSWKVEISNDGNKWEKIDERNNVSELNEQEKIMLFNINAKHDPFRYIRIITDKDNWDPTISIKSQGFSLGNLELFGNMIE